MLLFSKWRTIYFRFTIIFEVDMWYSHSCFVRLKVEHRQCKVQIPQIIVIYDCKIVECANRRKFALCVGNCTNTRTILDYQYCITSMILFWVAMRLSMAINSFAILVCSSFEGIPIYTSSKLRALIENTFVP